jgi:hypothetical protein
MTALVEFVEKSGVHSGVDPGGRTWTITRVFTGWRLEFRDTGDAAATYAGIHASLSAAQHEANRVTGRPGRTGRHGRVGEEP